jgi:hypothetical protein
MTITERPDFKQCGTCRESLPINHAGHKQCSELMLLSNKLAPYAITSNSREPKTRTIVPKCISNTTNKIRSVFNICS